MRLPQSQYIWHPPIPRYLTCISRCLVDPSNRLSPLYSLTSMSCIRTVLVIDDEAAVRHSLKAILSERFNVVACADGAQAITFASEHSGEVYAAFVDYAMPAMDGNQVCSALRTLDATTSLVGF